MMPLDYSQNLLLLPQIPSLGHLAGWAFLWRGGPGGVGRIPRGRPLCLEHIPGYSLKSQIQALLGPQFLLRPQGRTCRQRGPGLGALSALCPSSGQTHPFGNGITPLSHRYFLCACWVPGPRLGARGAARATQRPLPSGSQCPPGEGPNRQ